MERSFSAAGFASVPERVTRFWVLIAAAFVTTLPAAWLRLSGGAAHLQAPLEAATFGTAILGGAFLLTWAAEVAELDISQGLALAFLALVAVLPEYAVDLYFAWKAAAHPEYAAYATANMTGANRLLIGLAWPLIVLLYWWRERRTELELPEGRAVELGFLSLATVYSFVLPWKGTISPIDMVVFIGLFVGYVWRTAHQESEEPDIVGPALALARLAPWARRSMVVVFFLFAAVIILSSAEPFAEALLRMGHGWGVSEFVLVQWLAPLASEAPEVVIACILVMKGDAQAGMGAMVSSKVNQWTLLVGTLPLVYSLGLGHPAALPLDARQVEEIFLTSAQSLLGIAVLCNLRISVAEAIALLVLFVTQLFFPSPTVRYVFAFTYLTLAGALLVRNRAAAVALVRRSLRGVRCEP